MTTRKKTVKTATKKPVRKTKTVIPEKNQPISETSDPFLYSITALSKKFKLDRATVRERLEAAEILPRITKAKEKLFHLDDVEVVLAQSELNEAKLRKLDAEAELKELEVKKKLGEYASVAEFTEILQRLFGAFYQKTAIALPKRIASRLHNANSTAEVMEILQNEIKSEWKEFGENYPEYVNDYSRSNRPRNR